MKQIILLTAILILLLVSCAPKQEFPPGPPQVLPSDAIKFPQVIVDKSNQFVRAKVGDQFFNNYVRINYAMSTYNPPDNFCVQNPDSCAAFLRKPNYLMVYSLKIPQKPYVDELLEFAVDTDGNIISEREVIGIPNCANNPSECDFKIDEAAAIRIAQTAQLEKGTAPWKTSFHWHARYKKYIWTVSNTLTETGTGQMYRAEGKDIIIDANTGDVIEISAWSARA